MPNLSLFTVILKLESLGGQREMVECCKDAKKHAMSSF